MNILVKINMKIKDMKNWTVSAKCASGKWVYIGDHYFKFMARRHAIWAFEVGGYDGFRIESLWTGKVDWETEPDTATKAF